MIKTLKKRSQFVDIAKNGNHVIAKGLILQAIPSDSDTIEFGFTASKKLGNAVARNRIKRRLRAVVRDVLQRFEQNPETSPLRNGMHYVLIGRPFTIEREYKKLRSDLVYALHQLKDAGN